MTDFTDAASPSTGGQVAHFLVSLPMPLGVPDKYMHSVTYEQPFDFKAVRDAAAGGAPGFAPRPAFSALLHFHQVPLSFPESSADWLGLFETARGIFPSGVVPPLSADALEGGPSLDAVRTVVELVSELREDAIGNGLQYAFDASLECLRQFQRAYAAVTNHWTPLITRQVLPMMIPRAVRHTDGTWDFSGFIVNQPAIARIVPAQ